MGLDGKNNKLHNTAAVNLYIWVAMFVFVLKKYHNEKDTVFITPNS